MNSWILGVKLNKIVLNSIKTGNFTTESEKVLIDCRVTKEYVYFSILNVLYNTFKFNEKSFVYFRELEDSEIYNYVKNFDTLDKAGGYGIQDWIGFVGVDKIEGSYTNIMGFPLSKFIKKINEFLKSL